MKISLFHSLTAKGSNGGITLLTVQHIDKFSRAHKVWPRQWTQKYELKKLKKKLLMSDLKKQKKI